MKRALLVDTNFSSFPIYQFLESEGIDVTVIGGNPADFLAKAAKQYIQHNYSDPESTLRIIKEGNFDYLVPGCNDLSYQVCGQLGWDSFFGMDSPETTATINNKELFRAFAVKHHLSVPRVYSGDAIGTEYPLIVKPVDAYSGRGVKIIREKDEKALDNAIEEAKSFSRSGHCIVEEFVSGQLYSHSAFLEAQMIHTDFIVVEDSTASAFAVDTSRVVDFPPDVLFRIREQIQLMARILQLKDGLIHTQFIFRDGEFWLIEITRRCPGDQYSQLIEYTTGFPYAVAYTKPFIQASNRINYHATHRFITRHTMSFHEPVVLSGIHMNEPVEIEKFVQLAAAGDHVPPSPFGRIGVIFLRSVSADAQEKQYQKLLSRSLYKIY